MRFGDDDQRIMSGDEQAQVLAECLQQLNRLMGLGRRLTYTEEQAFTDYIVVALLSLLLGPRQEVLAHTTTMNLKPPRSLGNPRDTYYLQVSGHHLKDGPFSGAVPAVLTTAVAYYIQRVRPLTVGGPMFVGTNGLAREDFSTSTRRVTMAVLGTPDHRAPPPALAGHRRAAASRSNAGSQTGHGSTPRPQRTGPGAALPSAEAGAHPGDDAGRIAEESGTRQGAEDRCTGCDAVSGACVSVC